jgi:hypothetical protein
MVRERWPARTIAFSCASAALVALALVAPFWSGGAMAEGLKQAVAISQGLNTGSLASLSREYLQGQGAGEATLASVKLGLTLAFVAFALASPWLLRRLEHALVAVLCVFYLCVGSLFSWYLIPVIGLLALSCVRQPDHLALAYLFPATLLALLFNPVSVWAWFDRQMPPFHIHLGESLLLAVPMLLFIAFALRFSPKRQHTPHPVSPRV